MGFDTLLVLCLLPSACVWPLVVIASASDFLVGGALVSCLAAGLCPTRLAQRRPASRLTCPPHDVVSAEVLITVHGPSIALCWLGIVYSTADDCVCVCMLGGM